MSKIPIQAQEEMNRLLKATGEWSDEELTRMCALSSDAAPAETGIVNMAYLRGSLEMVLASRKFDRTTAQLAEVNRALTRRIEKLTNVGLILAGIGMIPAGIQLARVFRYFLGHWPK